MCTNVWAWKDHIDTVHLRGYNLCVELYNTCLIRVCVCVHVHVRAGNHHFNIALIKLPIYRCESTQEPFLGRLPPAAGRCQALWNPISSLLSDHYPLLSLSSPLSSSIGSSRCKQGEKKKREEEREEERGRWLVIHQHSQLALDQHPPSPAGTCWEVCKVQHTAKNRQPHKERLHVEAWKLVSMKGSESLPSTKDNYTSLQCSLVSFKTLAW